MGPSIPAALYKNNGPHDAQTPHGALDVGAVGTRVVKNASESAVRPRHGEVFGQGSDAGAISLNASDAASANGGASLTAVKTEGTGDAVAGKRLQDHLVSGIDGELPLLTQFELDTFLHDSDGVDNSEQPGAAVAPIRGHGIPHIEPNERPEAKTSEVTELGKRFYRARVAVQSPLLDQHAYPQEEGKLQRRLCKTINKTGVRGGRKFLPNCQLERLVNTKSVRKALGRRGLHRLRLSMSQTDIDARARQICGSSDMPGDDRDSGTVTFKKIFAILLLIDCQSKITDFIDEQVCDDDLPLHKAWENGKRKCFRLTRKGKEDTLKCFSKWDRGDITRFEEKQWSLLAPFFARGDENSLVRYNLPDDAILPFTFYEKIESHEGLNSVFKAQIHPSHHGFGSREIVDNWFAVKELHSANRKSFQQEIDFLESLSRKPDEDPHLISLLTVYEQHGNYYLVFPLAGGDLLQYWKNKNHNPERDRETALWLARQSRGIAEGLSRIHCPETFSSTPQVIHPSLAHKQNQNIKDAAIPLGSANQTGSEEYDSSPIRHLYGRHGDIKPENILWFPDPDDRTGKGTLKISDFGSTEVTTKRVIFRRDKRTVWNSPTYRPPEFDLNDGIISSSCDIWALGCLFLEFIAWYLGGQEYIDRFSSRRKSKDPGWEWVPTDTFFVIRDFTGKQKPELKPAVISPCPSTIKDND
ncbi:hypothetical protein FDECE_5139 [Fusarium decemcellulare]|nr:hypothetical protein FDECE_5139 [Fusarium decemcellulare]